MLNFKASKEWVKKFKKHNRIVSRKITHKVGKKFSEADTAIEESAAAFVEDVKSVIVEKKFTPDQIVNFDQSRFEKELRSGRTLASKGSKVIPGAIGSVSASTHSYMIMPTISMDGTLFKQMYVLVSEPSGKFPHNFKNELPNIKAYAGKSANMTKADLKMFLTEVFWPDQAVQGKSQILLLADSWTSNKDDDLYHATTPDGVQLIKKLIPAKCTGIAQPADVYFFRPYKNMVRFITDTVMISIPDINFWHRDHFLRLQSFVHYQFSSPKFKSMIKYAFFKCGYSKERPEQFNTPLEYCFESGLTDNCFHEHCSNPAFIKCAHCEKCYCLNHSLIEDLHIFCI